MEYQIRRRSTLSVRRRQSGAALVECVFAVIVLCTLAFGIVEVASMLKDSTSMYNLARSCARDLAAGKQYTGTVSKIITAANATGELGGNLSSSNISAVYTDTANGSSFPSSNVVGNDGTSGSSNNIPPGDLFKVDIAYQHNRLTSLFWNSNMTMHATVIMRRL